MKFREWVSGSFEHMGRLLAALDDDTLVMFLGDNGGISRHFKAGFRGNKGSACEGGTRPGQSPPARIRLYPSRKNPQRSRHRLFRKWAAQWGGDVLRAGPAAPLCWREPKLPRRPKASPTLPPARRNPFSSLPFRPARVLTTDCHRFRRPVTGAAPLPAAQHKETEVRAEWRGAPPPRLFTVATKDDSGLAVQIWNYSDEPAKAQVELSWLPEKLKGKARSRRYLVDSAHSNCLLQPDKPCELEMVSEETGQPARAWEVELEPHGLGLWLIEAAE